jgi:gentisate 1,2-dioxygenase
MSTSARRDLRIVTPDGRALDKHSSGVQTHVLGTTLAATTTGSGAMEGGEQLTAFEERLEQKSLCGHWQMVSANRQRSHTAPEPIVWDWGEIRSALDVAGDLVGIGGADDLNDRRTVHVVNPNLAHLYRTSETIQIAIQLVKPGETGEAHRHTQNAMRFVVDTTGDMYTTVEGEKLVMHPRDLLLTPNWTWHDHTNGSPSDAVWVDILDANLTRHLSAHFKELWLDGPSQPVVREERYSERRFGVVRPRISSPASGAVPYAYAWEDVLGAVAQLEAAGDLDEHEGYVLEYANPLDGGWTFPTMSCRVQMIPPGGTTRALRRVGVTLYQVVQGRGVTLVGAGEGGVGQTLRTPAETSNEAKLTWGPNDLMMVPSWRWYEHANLSDEPVFLFSVTDRPALEAFGWYREERR